MSSLSPAAILYSSDGYELAVVNTIPIPTGNRGILSAGSDGTNARFITVDTGGNTVVVGSGTAGTPTAGVVTIQGIGGMTPVSISGTVAVSSVGGTVSVSGTTTANQGTPNTIGNSWPVKITDGTNILGTSLNPLNVTGSLTTSKSSTGNITSTATSTSSTTLLAANPNRISATIFNDTSLNNILYIALSATASTSLYTVKLWPGAYWELPVDYTGIITGVWNSGLTGHALVTELT